VDEADFSSAAEALTHADAPDAPAIEAHGRAHACCLHREVRHSASRVRLQADAVKPLEDVANGLGPPALVPVEAGGGGKTRSGRRKSQRSASKAPFHITPSPNPPA
jgi:hypothetical protein